MARQRHENLSVLDRLLSESAIEALRGRGNVDPLHATIARDLEDMLNTRQPFKDWPSDAEQLPNSLMNYGLQDYTGYAIGTDQFGIDFADEIERKIKLFEPRFSHVRVTLHDDASITDREIAFKIEVRVNVDGREQAMKFDAGLRVANAVMTVK